MTDHSGSAAPVRAEVPASEASRSATASVSAGIAEANALMHKTEPSPRFPAEDSGRSLAAMAERDLDATLQLLAERAQYITGASGAAIALRRGQHKDMLCRASSGSNAPELGALLSMEYGLSGESVRTRQTLRCDDTERDERVNREGCRQLGIASVVVMPVLRDGEAIGVFELFSGKPNVFGERDVSALRRLSEMVETALKHAAAMHGVAEGKPAAAVSQISQGTVIRDEAAKEVAIEKPADVRPEPAGNNSSLPAELVATESLGEKAQPFETARAVEASKLEKSEAANAPTSPAAKPLFWSAQKSVSPPAVASNVEAGGVAVPAGLRNLQKCSACGFPVSRGRGLCVECEQKKWRGEPLAQTVKGQALQSEAKDTAPQEMTPPIDQTADREKIKDNTSSSETAVSQQQVFPAPTADLAGAEIAAATVVLVTEDATQPAETAPVENPAPFLSAAMQPESWFAANKYVIAGLVVVAIVIAAIVMLR